MSTKVGKTFGLALLMAVGILAVMFALGTFTSQKAGAATSDVSLALSSTDVGTDPVTVTVKFTESDGTAVGDEIEITLAGLEVTTNVSGTISGRSAATEDDPDTDGTDEGAAETDAEDVELSGITSTTDGVVTITIPDMDEDGNNGDQGLKGGEEITVVFTAGISNPDTAANAKATVDGEDSGIVAIGFTLDADPKSAGAASYITIEYVGENPVGVGDRVTVDMKSFGLPDSIDTDNVSLRNVGADGVTHVAAPDNVGISGSKISLIVPDMDGEPGTPIVELTARHRIIFRTDAGVTVPTTAGSYYVEIGDLRSSSIKVVESLSLSTKTGPSGTEVTVTGKGFSNDITSLFIDKVRMHDHDKDATTDMVPDPDTPDGNPQNDEYEIATNIDVEKGAFSHTFTVDKNFAAGVNYINVLKSNGASYREGMPTDADADEPNVYTTFTVTGKISLSTDSAQPGDEITVTLANFSEGRASATIGGRPLFPAESTDGSDKIKADIPVELTVGKHQVKVTVVPTDTDKDDETGSADITIEGLPLTVSPTSAVPGQEVTIKGTGFTDGAAIDVIEIGGVGADLGSTPILINNSGNFVANVSIPDSVSATGDDVLVEVRENDDDAPSNEGNNREGVARITIPKPTLTLDPETSRPDSTVVASGTGYVAGAVVEIEYDGKTVVSVNADGTGNWSKPFVVPTDKAVGNEYTVTAVGDDDVASKTASETHTIPGGRLTVSPLQGRPGTSVSLTGDGFTAYRPVSSITVGGLGVLTGIVNTDADGDFSTTILLPALPEGTHSLIVKVGDDTESIVFTVGATGPATTPTATVFKDLVDAGNLERVYHYVNATATWLVFDPRPDFAEFNDYTESTSGQAVWVKVTNDAQFQGQSLFAGWNLIVLQ